MNVLRCLTLSALLASHFSLRGAEERWIPFAPPSDSFAPSPLDLRSLNEEFAGEHGLIRARDGRFIRSSDNQPIRFWAVNGPPQEAKDPAELRRVARELAKHGVNLVRIHGPVFGEDGEPDSGKVQHIIDVVEAMKQEGIYSHASIYFPLWFRPKPGLSWLKGYDGKKNPFAALMFNPDFQAQYRSWWQALLLTPGARSGRKLIDEPALMSVEMQNEDSFFFWTFSEQNIPDEQLRLLEKQFGDWLTRRYGSLEAAFKSWNGMTVKRDAPEEGRVAFRPLWNIAHEKTVRDQDTAEFLLETQTNFYKETVAFLRSLGFRGLICASNWATASPEVLGPLEKESYMVGGFIDRHGYFSCFHKGEASEWSIRASHIYADRSALRFESLEPGQPRLFVHPAMDPQYDDKPSMISETTWTRPNRYRTEAPLFLAAYGALQDSDAIVHFAFDGTDWSTKPNFWMQPWTLMSPAMMGQFPAAALLYRQGLLDEGKVVARVALNREDLRALKGTPLPQDAALDELRLKDLPSSDEVKPGERLDPLLHFAGRTAVRFTDAPSEVEFKASKGLIDHERQRVSSSTGQLQLDYAKGTLCINAPQAQGYCGNLRALDQVSFGDVSMQSDLEVGGMIVVSLDSKPISSSRRLLLQVMSEEQNSGWKTEPAGGGKKRIIDLGGNPWMIKPIHGEVRLRRPDAAHLQVIALDGNGQPIGRSQDAAAIKLRPDVLYYIIEMDK